MTVLQTIKAKSRRNVTRLNYLRSMISKYSHRWGENPSARLCAWVDEYNDIRSDDPASFEFYCISVGACVDHDAYDILA